MKRDMFGIWCRWGLPAYVAVMVSIAVGIGWATLFTFPIWTAAFVYLERLGESRGRLSAAARRWRLER